MPRRSCKRRSRLPPEQLHYLESYANGVNASIDLQRGRLPLEFRILRYEPEQVRVLEEAVQRAADLVPQPGAGSGEAVAHEPGVVRQEAFESGRVPGASSSRARTS